MDANSMKDMEYIIQLKANELYLQKRLEAFEAKIKEEEAKKAAKKQAKLANSLPLEALDFTGVDAEVTALVKKNESWFAGKVKDAKVTPCVFVRQDGVKRPAAIVVGNKGDIIVTPSTWFGRSKVKEEQIIFG